MFLNRDAVLLERKETLKRKERFKNEFITNRETKGLGT